MVSTYIVVGSRGTVGSQVVQRLNMLNKSVLTVPAAEILRCSNISSIDGISSLYCNHSIQPLKSNLGLILSHRYRENGTLAALETELAITRNFVWSLSKICISLRVVVLGSITGRLVNQNICEAYHYSKDLQKSIVRQSVRIGNLHMNLLELNWFEKYSKHVATEEYKQTLSRHNQRLAGDNLPNVESITDFSCALIEMQRPPRGEIIVYDGGLSLLQGD